MGRPSSDCYYRTHIVRTVLFRIYRLLTLSLFSLTFKDTRVSELHFSPWKRRGKTFLPRLIKFVDVDIFIDSLLLTPQHGYYNSLETLVMVSGLFVKSINYTLDWISIIQMFSAVVSFILNSVFPFLELSKPPQSKLLIFFCLMTQNQLFLLLLLLSCFPVRF